MTPLVERYLSVRRAAGFGLRAIGSSLRSFARECEEAGLKTVHSDFAIQWAGRAPSPEQRDRRLSAVRHLAVFAAAEDPRHQIPPKGLFGGKGRRHPPRLLTPDEKCRLFHATDGLGLFPLVAYSLRVLLGLLACTGLRIGEACGLRCCDFTADGCLQIRKTKFKKSRLVPLHPSAEAALADYLHARGPLAPETTLFLSTRQKPLKPQAARRLFLRACAKAGLLKAGAPPPRLHSFRHGFAIRALECCQADRDAVEAHLLALTTYLGHSRIADTYWYLEATPELLRDIVGANERYLASEVLR